MHYYSFNVERYTSHTARLSILEDIAYRRLLDLYYQTEQPLNGCSTDVARDIGMREYQTEVDYILNKYFEKDGELWRNKRADQEIQFYHNKKKAASKAGKASGKARRSKAIERPLNDRSQSVEPTNNYKLTTSNKENKKESWLAPDWLNKKAWSEFESHRKEIKKPLTNLSRTKAANQLENLNHEQQQQVIDKSIQGRWAGLFPEKVKNETNRRDSKPNKNSHTEFLERTFERIESDTAT